MFDEIGDGALGLRAAEIHRHGLYAESFFPGFVLQHDIAHLGAVAVPDDDIVSAFQQIVKLGAGLFDIGQLFLISAFLAATQQRIASEGDHGKFLHDM